jgi:hypothetical protein
MFRHDCPLAVKHASIARRLVQKKHLRGSLSIDMLLSAGSVLVVAQSSSEIPEGIMNNPVYTVDPRVTTGLTYEQLGLRTKILVLTDDQILSYDPHGVRKLQSEPRYACLWK